MKHALAAWCVLTLAIAACARGHEAEPRARQTSTLPRIISLAPSLTEIAYAIECGPALVGDTAYDDYPPQAKGLPHVADLVSVDIERVAALSPTIVAALHDQEREGSQVAARLGVRIVYLPNRNLADLFADIDGMGAACDRSVQARALAAKIRAQVNSIARRARRGGSHPRVLYLLGLPGFTAGKRSYINDVLSAAGAINVAGDVAQPYPNLSAEQILALDPDVIVVSRSVTFGADVRNQPPWRDLRAIRAGRVLRPPNDDEIERNGPRVVLGLGWLVHALHP